MVIRIAVSIVLLCAGVLLLSACGLNLLIPPRQPQLYGQSLVLWQVEPGAAPVQLGLLQLSGTLSRVQATLTLSEPACLDTRQLDLTGSVLRARSPELTLTPQPSQSVDLQLKAYLPPQAMVYTVDASAANGILSFGSGCAAGRPFPFQAREKPLLSGEWHGAAAPAQFGTIQQFFAWPQTRVRFPEARIAFRHNPCFQSGETTSAGELPPIPQHFTLAFKMDTGATLTADTAVDVLTRNTPLVTRYSIHGGACDGQSFTATLHRE